MLAERTRLLQLSTSGGDWDDVAENFVPTLPSPKFDWIIEKLAELGIPDEDNENRIILSSHRTALLKLFSSELRKLGINNFLLTGETSDKERQRITADFQSENPSARVFLLNAKAGGVALTLDMADDLVLIDQSTIPDEDEQVEDRAHRTSRMHQLTIHILCMLDTIEEEVAWVAAARESTQKYILDGSRGVSYARNVYLARREDSTAQGV